MAQTAGRVEKDGDQDQESDGESRCTVRYDAHDGDNRSNTTYGASRTRRSRSRDTFDTRSRLGHTNPANGLFDESYFAYYEDVDLAWRAQNAGWRCRYVPAASLKHWHSATSKKDPAAKQFLLGRNKL